MTTRIQKLREQSMQAVPALSAERAEYLTDFYTSVKETVSPPVQRAQALAYLLEHKYLWIGDDELIVGERGPEPKATPTYPEICLHSLEDLDILHHRPKVSFRVSPEFRSVYEQRIIPFWKGKTIREQIFSAMEPVWLEAYQAGIFTEFLEQRPPGHTAGGEKIFKTGMRDLIQQIQERLKQPDVQNDSTGMKREQLEGMRLAAWAIIRYARRYAEKLDALAENESNIRRKNELREMAAICRRVPEHRPETFHEALQHYWFLHLGVITELNPWDSFSPGRLDQHLYPFYLRDIREGRLTPARAVEILQAFWIKFNNHPAPPKVGVTAKESNTYTDFTLINIGGLTPDGKNAVNDLSYILLDVIEEMRLVQPGSMIQVSRENPDELIHRALKIIRTGFGQPSIFNTDGIVQELVRQGKTIEDARCGGASGCVEAGAFGKECYILTGYLNLVKILEIALNHGIDPRTGKKIGLTTGNSAAWSTFDDLMLAYEKQLRHFVNIKMRGNAVIADLYARRMPAPFLSLLIDDCIDRAVDYNAGGARYNTSYIQGVGIGTLTDSLTALKYHVFDQRTLTLPALLEFLNNNFSESSEWLRRLIYETPKYGNDDIRADAQAEKVFEIFFKAVDGRPAPRGGNYHINLLPTTCHVYFGSVTGATPDGRLSGQPLSEGISPVQGADHRGPTGVIRSVAHLDHQRTGGTLLNMKFTPSFFQAHQAFTALTALIRTHFRMNGHHIQFNVVSADTLREAQKYPERYRDLIVRVAGYSDYFNDLGEDLQNEIIQRTEHESVAQ